MKDNRLFYAALSVNEAVGVKRFEKIIEKFPDLQGFFDLSPREQIDFLKIPTPENQLPHFEKMIEKANRVLETCEKKKIRFITREDSDYSPRLRLIPEAPFAYYQIGQANESLKTVGIVGTRKASRDALEVNRYFSSVLAEYKIGIISGLALGHDAEAQKAALNSDGYTAAILGSGIDVIYPAANKNLYHEIAEKGMILSENPPGARAMPYHFPLRNRIISGLSDAILVIQAPEKSGSLITARYAAEQNKDVFSVPGSPRDKRNSGSNLLIQRGAKMVLQPEEIVESLLGALESKRETPKKKLPQMSVEEESIWNLLKNETYIDEILEKTEIPVSKLNSLLTTMELKGMITQFPGRFFARKG